MIDWTTTPDKELIAIEPVHTDELCWCKPDIEEYADGDVIIHHSLRSIVTGVSDEYWNGMRRN